MIILLLATFRIICQCADFAVDVPCHLKWPEFQEGSGAVREGV